MRIFLIQTMRTATLSYKHQWGFWELLEHAQSCSALMHMENMLHSCHWDGAYGSGLRDLLLKAVNRVGLLMYS